MTPTTINRVHARRIWDSRGRPTVEAEIRLAGGASAAASRPQAPRAARAKRSTCATAARARAASTSRRPWPT